MVKVVFVHLLYQSFALCLRSEGSILSPFKRTAMPTEFPDAWGEEISPFSCAYQRCSSLQQELWLFKVMCLAAKSVKPVCVTACPDRHSPAHDSEVARG